MVIDIGKISAGIMVFVTKGALSEMALQFRTTVSLNNIQGRSPHKRKTAKLVVPEMSIIVAPFVWPLRPIAPSLSGLAITGLPDRHELWNVPVKPLTAA